MRVSLKWLQEYVDVPTDIKAFCDRLDLTGTGVEGVEKLGAQFDKVVVGHVLSCEEHPDSDHMHVVMVDVAQDEPLQIVCGAPNIAAGIKLPVALVGAELPGDIKIKKGKLRGVVSNGMCCSKRELGQGSDHTGIWVLPDDAPVGMPIADYLKLSDTVLDLEITPNRPDCLSMVGMAREVGAMYRTPVTYPTYSLEEQGEAVQKSVTVEIAEAARCPRYTARVIENVKVGPSPEWLAERVTAAGARSINNLVDVTNYILFLLSQPLHAFDFDALAGEDGVAHIVVRPAQAGEVLTTLDGTDRELIEDMTVIATPERAVALAGVMGGLDTEVTEQTTTILLEAATFERGRTSRTSRNLGLISESSLRYERGVDDNPIEFNAAFAAALIAEVSGGTVRPGMVDVWTSKTEPIHLQFRVERFNNMMGAEIAAEEIQDILERLGCTVNATEEAGVFADVAPSFRPDLEREIDLYEEVLRLHGMDLIPSTLPGGRGRYAVRTIEQQRMDVLHNSLRACGLNETMTYSFVDPNDLQKLRMDAEAMGLGKAVELLNPMSSDQSVMRQSIVPGLLRSVAYNQNRGVKNVQLYEIGAIFCAAEGRKKPKERQKLAAVMAGAFCDKQWNVEPVAFDFFDGKGVIENICRELCIPKLRFKALEADAAPFLQPGRACEVLSGGTSLGWFGELHPLAVAAFDAEAPVVAMELDVAALLKSARAKRDYVDVPNFPAVSMDVAFVVDEDVTSERLLQCMTSAGGKLLESATLFDVYRDEQRLGAGKKSMAYALVYRDANRTLTSEEVDKTHERLIKKVSGATGAEVRG